MLNDIYKLFKESNTGVLTEDENLVFNFDKWEKNTSYNILFITGHSGSGKSTLAQRLADEHNATILCIDIIEYYREINESNIIVENFRDKHPDIKKRMDNDWEGISSMAEVWEDIVKFMKYSIRYMREDPSTLYILEGIQLYEHFDGDKFKDSPIIIKDTGAMKAFHRRLKRDNDDQDLDFISFIKHLKNNIDKIPWYWNDSKMINNFKKKINRNKEG